MDQARWAYDRVIDVYHCATSRDLGVPGVKRIADNIVIVLRFLCACFGVLSRFPFRFECGFDFA
ncbi:hypothetical protein D1872_270200 [compost metagenome]